MSGISSSTFKDGPLTQTLITRQLRHLRDHPESGAIEFFLGQVRPDQKANGKKVVQIDYQCYRKMALIELVRIYKDAFEIFGINELIIRHSLGKVPAGSVCFLVGVSAAHRQDARNAVAFVVDRIKDNVPIYGKEILGDGFYLWKENN